MNEQFGIPQQPIEAQPAPASVCTNCGTPMNDGQAFCVNCGAPRSVPQSSFCTKCGTPLQPGQAFCTNCGQPANAPVNADTTTAINQFNNTVVTQKKKSKLPVVLGIIAAIVVLIIIISAAGGDSGSAGNSGISSNSGGSYDTAQPTEPVSGSSYYDSLAVGSYSSIGYMDDGEIKTLPTGWAKLTLNSNGSGKLTYNDKTMTFTWYYSKTTDGNHYYAMNISDGGATAFVLLDDYLVMQVGELQLIFD